MTTTPQAVSAAIRRAGVIIPTPRGREGTHVTRGYGGTVHVSLDYDTPDSIARARTHIVEILAAGYLVIVSPDGTALYVSKDA